MDRRSGNDSMNELVITDILPALVPNDDPRNVVRLDDKEGRLKARSRIDYYEEAIKRFAGSERGIADELNEKGLKEHFIGGAYIRELFIPAGVTIVSEIWNKERFWIIVYGDVTIMTETNIKRVRGHHTEVPPFGSKAALYTHEDTLWFAITGSESTNSEDIKKEVITKDYALLDYPWG